MQHDEIKSKINNMYAKKNVFADIVELERTELLMDGNIKSKIKIIPINYNFLKASFSIINFFHALIGSVPTVTPRILDSLFVNRISTSVKAKTELKYKPTSLQKGLKETITYLKQAS